MHLTALEKAQIIPGKDSDTRIKYHFRIKPLALTNGYGRYMAITSTPERPFHFQNGRFTSETTRTLLLNFCPFHFRNRRFTSETAFRWFQNLNRHLDPEVVLKNPLELLEGSRYNIFQGGNDGYGYRNM